jgi:hypothetical protein
MTAVRIGDSWRTTFIALGAQLALLTGAWLAPAGMVMFVTRMFRYQYGFELFLLGLLLLIYGSLVWARQVGFASRRRAFWVSALSLLGIVFCVAGSAVYCWIGAVSSDSCSFNRWGWCLIAGLYYAVGLPARYGGRWMPFLVPLAVLAAGIAFSLLVQAAGTCGFE